MSGNAKRAFPAARWCAVCLSTMLPACSLAPTYRIPEAAHPEAFKEARALSPETAARWKEAEPADDRARGAWWTVFGDDDLDRLETEASSANQSLKAAFARLQQARALRRGAESARYPAAGVGFGPTRQLAAPGSLGVIPGADPQTQTVWRAEAVASYEVDLFGRVASTIAAATADAERSEALFGSLQLAMQADVAENHFELRQLDAELAVYAQTVELRSQALDFVQHRFDAGDVSGLEVAQARAELESARADLLGITRRRAVVEHALAVLVGRAPAEMAARSNPLIAVTVRIPAGLPSSLLERRPDVAAAERAMGAENARIGVARAAYFPSLSLTGVGGFESSSLGDLFRWSSRAFLLGPLVGTALNLPVFDGGARRAGVDVAWARYDESVANYRQQVLTAFKEVEDNLGELRILEEQRRVQDRSVSASSEATSISRTQYANGSVNYLYVIDSERTLLQSRRNAVQLTGAQAIATVRLIRALGGGWSAADAS